MSFTPDNQHSLEKREKISTLLNIIRNTLAIAVWVLLQAVKEQMEVMKDKDTLINVRNQNHEKLLTELESLVVSLVRVPEFMKDKDTLINVRNQNHEKLLTELESLVVSLVQVPEFMNGKHACINVRNQNHEKLLTE